MSKINDLISPKKEVVFRGEKFMIDAGFTLEETPLLHKAFSPGNEDAKAEAMRDILKMIVKKLYPDAAEEEISQVDIKHSADLLEVYHQIDETEESEKERIKKLLEKRIGKK